MLVSFVLGILAILWGSTPQEPASLGLGGGPIVAKEKFSTTDRPLKVELKEFEKIPRLVSDPDPEPPLLWSHSAIVIDADSGKILYEKDAKKKVPIASLTKVVTALVLDEKIYDWNQDVKISQKAAFAGGAGISLKWDEIIKADDLLKAMLMNSDNSAAIALAEHVSGSTTEFAKLMDQKAKELGALNSHFEEPSGLEDEKSYSSAYDFAKISQALLKKERLVKIMQTKGPIEVNSCDGLLVHRVGNTNIFLKNDRIAPSVIAAKTGFTYNAGYCLMTSFWDKAQKRRVVGVILNSGEEMRWEEMKEVLDWSLKNYEW